MIKYGPQVTQIYLYWSEMISKMALGKKGKKRLVFGDLEINL
jgi:hypothetical protein